MTKSEAAKLRRMARKLSLECTRRAQVLSHQAKREFALGDLHPYPDNKMATGEARQKVIKARRLRRVSRRFAAVAEKKLTGLGADPGPVVMYRTAAHNSN